MTPQSKEATTFTLRPTNHLRAGDESGVWEAYGNDPAFEVVLPPEGLVAGWYEVDVGLEVIDGPEATAFFYPDYGFPEREQYKVYLPFAGDGKCIVLFAHPVKGLRFDPTIAVCEFRIADLRLHRMGRGRAALGMLKGLMARAKFKDRILLCSRLLRDLAFRGARAMASSLNTAYAEPPISSTLSSYQQWLDRYDQPHRGWAERARQEIASLSEAPLVSIVLPVYETPERWLVKCIESVRDQVYPHWELCIADDASREPHVRRVLQRYAALDPRIRVVHRPQNGHISASSNSAIEMASGRWMALLDHDDQLHPLAIWEMVRAAQCNPRWRIVYSDEDKIDEQGRRYDPYMKPDFNYELFLSHNCISHLGIYDLALVREAGCFRTGMEGSQDWDLALRCIERLDHDQVGHVPQVLYHWRAIQGSTALAPQEKDYAHLAGARAIQEHLDRTGTLAVVQDIPGQRGNYRICHMLPEPSPKVSIIIPTRDKLSLVRSCVDSIIEHTTWPDYEIVIVDNGSIEADTLNWLAQIQVRDARVRVLRREGPFNYPDLNNAGVDESVGAVLCLLNNDITVITPGWLEELVGHALRPGIGAVGAMLYYPNDTIQHAGVIVGAHGIAAHAYSGRQRGDPGHMSRARLAQEMTAVTAACLVVRRSVWEEVGGLDPALAVAFNDVDFCLRVRALGYRNVWTPFAELYHHESASRGYEDSPEKAERFTKEIALMRARWGDVLTNDPMYSRNHTVVYRLHEFAYPPRVDKAGRADGDRIPSAPSRTVA